MKLDHRQKNDPLWLLLKEHLERRLADLRVLNDKPQPDEKTEHLRGRIAAYKELLALDSPAPVVTPDPDSY